MKVKPMPVDELANYFNEHVLYELLMLRYTKIRLEPIGPEGPYVVEQLLWNAMFAAFNVSARNIYDFLNGDDKQNVRVVDYRPYCRSFALGSIDDIRMSKDMLHAQCLHMGRGRTKLSKDKITIDRIQKMSEWIEGKMQVLTDSFNAELRSKVNPERADPRQSGNWVLSQGPTGPSAPPLMLDVTTTSPTATNHPTPLDTKPGN